MHKVASGKVREIYELDQDHLLLVTSDRISAFDVVMQEPVPDRGRVLVALTDYWLTECLASVPNHLVSTSVPDVASDLPDVEGRCQVVRKAEMLPVEFIVRARLAGSGWKEYSETSTLHGTPLPKGLQLGDALPQPVLTPSTKAELGAHDINITWDQGADLIGTDAMKRATEMCMAVFETAAATVLERGFVLADTKFEVGVIDGELALCDEVLTPDSSRYWPVGGWERGEVPPPFDKQLLREWLESQPWDKTPPPPPLTAEIVEQTRARYVEAYERITRKRFADWPGVSN